MDAMLRTPPPAPPPFRSPAASKRRRTSPAFAAIAIVAMTAAGCGANPTTAALDLASTDLEQTTASERLSEPAPDEPLDWRVGFTWPFMTDNRLIAATEMALRACVLGRVEGLETADIVQDGRRFDVLRPATGERLFWMEISGDPDAVAEKTLDLNWVEGLGDGAGPRFLTQVDRAVRGQQPC